jgi:hypothetical protein
MRHAFSDDNIQRQACEVGTSSLSSSIASRISKGIVLLVHKKMKLFIFLICVVATKAWVPPSQRTTSRTHHLPTSTRLSMGVTSTVKRFRDSILSKERSREDLKIGIAGFYDRSSKLWEDIWGEVCS